MRRSTRRVATRRGGGETPRRRRKTNARARARREAGRAILGTFLGVALVTWVLYAAGLRGGDGNGSSSVDVIEKAFAAGPHGIANLVVTTVILAPMFRGGRVSRVHVAVAHEIHGHHPSHRGVGADFRVDSPARRRRHGATRRRRVWRLGVVYARTRNLAASIAVHAAFNASVIALFALWVS